MNFRNVCTHKISRNTAPKHNRSIRERAIIIFIKKKKIIPVRSTLSDRFLGIDANNIRYREKYLSLTHFLLT